MSRLLIEREGELGRVASALGSTRVGSGMLVVVEGTAGIGKTSLLREAARTAESEDMRVLVASGTELEREFGFGVVRQLFERLLRDAPADERDELVAGAAHLAIPVVAHSGVTDPAEIADPQSVVHGLYWLTSNLAERDPVLIVIDDAHWSDEPSLRFIAYLARRLDGLRVMLLVASRAGEAPSPGVVLAAATEVLRPAALTQAGVATLVRERLGAGTSDELARACHAATGGVPFLVTELLASIESDGPRPSPERLGQLVPETIRRATLLRLARLPTSTAAVARAVAVLGTGAELRRVAALANVDPDEALVAVAALVEIGLLAPGRPVSFAHPILRAAVYDELTTPERASAHRRAASILAAEAASPEQVAAHLLHTEPEASSEAVATLRAAATEALARGAPDGAVAYLRRALAEPVRAERGALLHELGRVELLAGDHAAIDDFEEAIALATGPVDRARVICDAYPVYLLAARFDRMQAAISALEPIVVGEPELVAKLSGHLASAEAYDPRLAAEYDRKLPSRRQLADAGGPPERLLNGLLAAVDALRGARGAEVLPRAELALDGGRLLSEEGAASTAMIQAVCAFIIVDELERAEALAAEMVDDAQRRGSPLGFASGLAHRGLVNARLGRLAIAEADFMLAASLAREHELPYPYAVTLLYASDVLLERPAVAELADAALAIELPPALAASATGGWIHDVRGRLLRARGDVEAAVVELELASEIYAPLGFDGLLGIGWRDELALALPPERREEALRLAAESVERAGGRGSARAHGIALRALGLLQGGETGLDSLRSSLSVLERAPSPLERARTLVELGAALRRSGERASAREPLRAALDLAERCGAQRLSERALIELRATGAKPRRRTVEGRDALTASETRVAEMGASGMSNRAIAQALFVTAKTVENQLGAVYLKLGIHRRDQLPSALAHGAPERAAKT